MKTRNFALCALGLAAAITIGSADASAQARSQTRIPVRKEQPPEPPKVDTVRVTRVDTVTIRSRPDTIVRTVERLRVDTVMQQLPLQRLPGWYFGIGGGVAVPMNNWRNTTKDGGSLQGMVGWFPGTGALGIRIDALGNWLSNRSTDCPACPSPSFFEANADLVLRFPLDRTSWLNPTPYLLAGGGIDKFSDFLPFRNSDGRIVTAGENTFLGYPGLLLVTTPGAVNFRGDQNWFFNYNFGAGIDWRTFGLTWYVETKYTTISMQNGNAHYWPITIGLKFF